jgi:hypothetical protein
MSKRKPLHRLAAIVSFIAAMLSAGLCPSLSAAEVDWEELQGCAVKVVTIKQVAFLGEMESSKEPVLAVPIVGHGSGSVWQTGSDGTFIVTNSHVVEGAFAVAVGFKGLDQLFPAHVFYQPYQAGITSDVAVLAVDVVLPADVCVPSYDMGTTKVGEEIRVFGYPLFSEGDEASQKEGTVSRKQGELMETSASINQGNSGGPVFNKKGELVGIVVAKISEAEGMGYYIPIDKVSQYIKMIPKKQYKDWEDRKTSEFWGIYEELAQSLRWLLMASYTAEELYSKFMSEAFVSSIIAIEDKAENYLKSGAMDKEKKNEIPEIFVLFSAVVYNVATAQEEQEPMEKMFNVSLNFLDIAVSMKPGLKAWDYYKMIQVFICCRGHKEVCPYPMPECPEPEPEPGVSKVKECPPICTECGKCAECPPCQECMEETGGYGAGWRNRWGHLSSLVFRTGFSRFNEGWTTYAASGPGADIGGGMGFVIKPLKRGKVFSLDIIIEPYFDVSFGNEQKFWAAGGGAGIGMGFSFLKSFYWYGLWDLYFFDTAYRESSNVSVKGFAFAFGIAARYVEIEIFNRLRHLGKADCDKNYAYCEGWEPRELALHQLLAGLRFVRW